MKDFQAAYIMI